MTPKCWRHITLFAMKSESLLTSSGPLRARSRHVGIARSAIRKSRWQPMDAHQICWSSLARSGTVPLAARELESALLDTGRPVLIPGSKPPCLETVAIAWKATREAARAVGAALPFLLRAKRLAVICAAEAGAIDRAGTERLVTTLRRHHGEVETCYLQPASAETGEAILSKAQEIGAGLVVMGAYGHGRVRELVFGGVTERVLKCAELPLLMAH